MHGDIAALVEAFKQEWWKDARCVGMDPAIFFPEKGKTAREAKAICADCDALAACREYGLTTNQKYGVWGGLTERDRRRVKKDRRESLDT